MEGQTAVLLTLITAATVAWVAHKVEAKAA
jgi:hypothetical protein